MPIKLPVRPVPTAAQEHADHVARHKDAIFKVEEALGVLMARHRKDHEDFVATLWQREIDRFIESRKPNGTPCDTLAADLNRQKEAGVKHPKVDPVAQGFAMERIRTLQIFTDFPSPETSLKIRSSYPQWLLDTARPAFPVRWRTDGHDTLRDNAKKHVDEIAATFTRKTVKKVLDIILTKGGYNCDLTGGSFSGGVFEGDLTITFRDSSSFRTHLIVKHNTSVLGKAFVQYPLTFHDIVIAGETTPRRSMSEDQLWDAFGVSRPAKFKKRRAPWPVVKIGDIVTTPAGRRGIVVATKTDAAMVSFDPSEPSARLEGGDISGIVARTMARSNGRAYLFVEPFEGKRVSIFTPQELQHVISQENLGAARDAATRKHTLSSVLEFLDRP